MKLGRLLAVTALIAVLAAPSMALANSVKVKGDIQSDGYLTIDFDWKVDTRNYPGKDRKQVKDAVHDQMYNAMMPKLAAKTRGMPVSYEKCHFTLISEKSNLVDERSDGTKVYDVKTKVRFNAPYMKSAQAPDAAMTPEQKTNVRGNWQAEFW